MLSQPQRRSIWGGGVTLCPRHFAGFALNIAERPRGTLKDLPIGGS